MLSKSQGLNGLLKVIDNSKFFHGILKIHSSAYCVYGLMVENKWITNPNDIKDEAMKHFGSRLAETSFTRLKLVSTRFKKPSMAQCSFLADSFSIEEIKTGVWDCGSDKHRDFFYSFPIVSKF